MNYHTGWQLRHIISQIDNENSFSSEELNKLTAQFQEEIPSLESDNMQKLMSWFSFSDAKEFANFYNGYNLAKKALLEKFPLIVEDENEGLILAAQKHYVSNLKAENILSSGLDQRTIPDGTIITSFIMPRCIFGIDYQVNGSASDVQCQEPILPISGPDFRSCPNFITNNCQAVFDGCVFEQQLNFIRRIVSCFGQEFIWWDVSSVLSGDVNCSFSITGEYVCPGNPNGIGGFSTVIHILDGMHVSSQPLFPDDPFGCYDLVICDYYTSVCITCENPVMACCN